MAYAYAARAAAAFNHRVGLTPTGIMLIGTPEATAAAILEHLRETMPGAISRNGQPQATTPVRLTLEGTFDAGPSFINISDPEIGYQRRWNIANLGQGDEREIMETIENTVGRGMVEYTTTVHAWTQTGRDTRTCSKYASDQGRRRT